MKSLWVPVSLLALILALSLVNGALVSKAVGQWDALLLKAEDSALQGDWDSARRAVEDCYQQWGTKQTWLHIVERHGELDQAETLFMRTSALAAQEELSDFLTESQDLRSQRALLAEMEQLSAKNVLTYFPAVY